MSSALATAALSPPASHPDPLTVPVQLPRRRYGQWHRLAMLSPASVGAFERCPEAFRRRYLLGEKVPPNLSMTLGSVVGDALAHYFQATIDGGRYDAKTVDDLVVELFEAKISEAVLAPNENPELGKAQCRAGVADYLEELAPSITPISVERRASFRFCEEQEWSFVCFFDLECVKQLADLQFGKNRVKESRAAKDLQATAQTYMRWAEGNPAEFTFHTGLLEPEGAPRWSVVSAPRTVTQLRGFERRVARVARQIVHLDQTEPGEWPLSADFGWWCAPQVGTDGCPYWESCPVGGGAAVIA